ncbi:MAG: hypothetical protein KDK02_02380 [Rhodobacteraceae bacterium]|nr:hypothetical protein [Paracoccaceae bacterium]
MTLFRPVLSPGLRAGSHAGSYAGLLAALLACAAALAPPAAAQTLPDLPDAAVAHDGIVLLTPDNTRQVGPPARRLAHVVFPARSVPVLGGDPPDPAYAMLRRMVAAGQAAGNSGDLYENRDHSHSSLSHEAFPQLTHVRYDARLRAQGFDYGLPLEMLFDAPVIGNASLAQTGGPLWRSLPRLALTMKDGAGAHLLFQNYASGQIHVFPEHRDHDPEYGDLLPANTPYMLISQGSSGSDRPHLRALAMILAAFRPDTKAVLRETGLIAPTVQMVYRRARVGVRSRAAYLSGGAHPSVFRDSDIALARMVGLANSILPGEVPPMVRLAVLEETASREGVDHFGAPSGEVLFDTPSAIARVWRSRRGRRVMVVTAAGTRDPNGRALRFDWVVLRGDPERVTVQPLMPDGRAARIVIDWQEPRPTPGAPDIVSDRVDIGVFANNGIHDSAPAFISVLLPRHERRIYEPGPDGTPRIASLDRAPRPGVYADPRLFPETPWRDVYRYDADGRLEGWVRHRADGTTEYDADGNRILSRDARGVALETLAVRYLPEPVGGGAVRLREEAVPPAQ